MSLVSTGRGATSSSQGEQIVTTPPFAADVSGVVAGYAETSGTGIFYFTPVPYTLVSTNGQRSIQSTDINDNAVGLGARRVRVVYLNEDFEGPFQEDILMNGVGAVNTFATDICYVLDMYVVNIGNNLDSGASGTITLFTGVGGAGTAMATIQSQKLGRQQGYFVVPKDKECVVSAVQTYTIETVVAQGHSVAIRCRDLTVSDAAPKEVTEPIFVPGQTSTVHAEQSSPVVAPEKSLIYLHGWARAGVAVERDASFTYYLREKLA